MNTTAIALIKSCSLLLASDLGRARLSASKHLHRAVIGVTPDTVEAQFAIDADGGCIAAIVAPGSVKTLSLSAGVLATATFKAFSGIVAVTA